MVQDISERKRTEKSQLLLAQVGNLLRTSQDEHLLMQKVCERTSEMFGASLCSFAEVDEDRNVAWMLETCPTPGPELSGEFPLSAFGPIIDQLRGGETVFVADARIDSRTAATYESAYEPLGARCFASVPVHLAGKWIGTFGVTSNKARAFRPEDIEILDNIGHRVWYTVMNLRARRELANLRLG